MDPASATVKSDYLNTSYLTSKDVRLQADEEPIQTNMEDVIQVRTYSIRVGKLSFSSSSCLASCSLITSVKEQVGAAAGATDPQGLWNTHTH